MVDSPTKRIELNSSKADAHIFAKSFEECLDRSKAAEAFPRGQIVGEDDVLDALLSQRVDIEVSGLFRKRWGG